DGVVAQIGLATDEPARERRAAVVAHLLERPVPVHQARLLGPEAIAVAERAAVEVGVAGHGRASSLRMSTTMRPRTLPSIKACACATASASATSRVIASSRAGSR